MNGYQKSNRQSSEDGWLPSAKSRSNTFVDTSKFRNKKSVSEDHSYSLKGVKF